MEEVKGRDSENDNVCKVLKNSSLETEDEVHIGLNWFIPNLLMIETIGWTVQMLRKAIGPLVNQSMMSFTMIAAVALTCSELGMRTLQHFSKAGRWQVESHSLGSS